MSRFRNRYTGAIADVDDSRDGSLGARWERVDSTPAPDPAPVLEPVDPAPVLEPSDVDGDPSPDAEGS